MSRYIRYVPYPLLDDIIEGRCIPIIGAGFSRNADLPSELKMPLWNDIGKLLAQQMNDYPYSTPIDAISAFCHDFSRAKLVEQLRSILHIDIAQPGLVHLSFADLPFDTVITTNFDFLLEKAYDIKRRPYYPIVNEDQLPISNIDMCVLKIHGDLNHPSRLVITEEDYDTFQEKYHLMYEHIANLLISKTPLLIGYSLEDPDLRQIWQILGARLGNLRRSAYAILVGVHSVDVERYERRGVKVISLPDETATYGDILSTLFQEIREYWLENKIPEYQEKFYNKHPLLFHDSDEIERLLEFMRGSDQDEQVRAKLIIKKLFEDKKQDLKKLIDGLISIFINCKDRITQSHVLDTLVYLDVKEVIPKILKQIERNLMLFEYRETPGQLRHVYTDFLFNALVKLKANTIYPSIKHFLEYNDEFLTRGVIRTCGELNIKESVSDVLTFLKHPKIEIREEAGRALSKMDEEVITKELKRILEHSANGNEISGAIYVFAIKKDKSVEDKVITFANSSDRDVRKSVALYLGEINSVKNIGLLLNLVIDDDSEVRDEAVRSIVNKLTSSNKEKEDLALPLLKKTCEEKRIQQVNSLLSIINRCGSEKSIPILLEIYQNEKGETYNFRWKDYEREMEYFQQVNLKTNALEILKRFDIQEIQDDIIKEIREAEDDLKIKYIIAAGEMKIAAAFNEITNLLEQGYTMWSNFIPSRGCPTIAFGTKNFASFWI